MNKRLLAGIVLCGMAAGAADAIYYRGNGTWADVGTGDVGTVGWNDVLPGSGDAAELRLGNTVTLNYNAPMVYDLTVAQGRVNYTDDRSGDLTVQSGGSLLVLNQISIGHSAWNGEVGTLTIDAGGSLQAGSVTFIGNDGNSAGPGTGVVNVSGTFSTGQLWFGRLGSSGTMTINNGGTVSVTGTGFGLGTSNGLDPSGGTGTLTVESGGLLSLNTWNNDGTNTIQSGSVLNINGTGMVTLNGDRVDSADSYIAAGKIATDQPSLLASYDAGSDVTTIVAIPEPATLGMVAAFGGALLLVRRRLML